MTPEPTFARQLRKGTSLVLHAAAVLLVGAAGCTPPTPVATGPQEDAPPAAAVENVEEHYPDGALRVRRSVLFEPNGTSCSHGVTTEWYPDGQRAYEATFAHGQKQGVTTRWHRNGQPWIERHFDQGVIHGVTHTWDEAGTLRGEEHHDHGRPCGIWTVWTDKGEIKSQQDFGPPATTP